MWGGGGEQASVRLLGRGGVSAARDGGGGRVEVVVVVEGGVDHGISLGGALISNGVILPPYALCTFVRCALQRHDTVQILALSFLFFLPIGTRQNAFSQSKPVTGYSLIRTTLLCPVLRYSVWIFFFFLPGGGR